MLRYKHVSTMQQTLDQTMESLLQHFRKDILLVKCTNKHGDSLAIRGAIKLGHKAFDMFAAATPVGRKEYASNLCFWKLIELCERDRVIHYDLSGVDPEGIDADAMGRMGVAEVLVVGIAAHDEIAGGNGDHLGTARAIGEGLLRRRDPAAAGFAASGKQQSRERHHGTGQILPCPHVTIRHAAVCSRMSLYSI